MKTDVVTPQQVFYNPSRLVVPLFQRPYVWSKETQWEPLWDDIKRLVEVIEGHDQQATHFLGAIVIQQVQVPLGRLATWNVIDGQQRLTTLQLLLDALHAVLEVRSWVHLAERILALVENPRSNRSTDEDRFKLWPTNRDRDAFTSVMAASTGIDYESIAASRLRDAHQYFSTAVAEWIGDGGDAQMRAATLVAAISERLEIASITLEVNEDAQAIFETLNARGTPLTAADLIKNYVFQQLDPADAEHMYSENWAEFETPWWEEVVVSGRIKNSRISLFLWQWLIARTLDDFPVREVFSRFKHYVTTSVQDVRDLLPRVKAAAVKYRALAEGAQRVHGPLDRPELFAYRVGSLDTDVARPLLIWLDEPEQVDVPVSERERLIEVLESWFVRRALIKSLSHGTNRLIVDLLRHLSTQPHDALAGATEAFLASNRSDVGYWPSDAEVRQMLETVPAYTRFVRRRLRMVLEAVEDADRGYPNGERLSLGPIERSTAMVEHLMPQRWRQHWDEGLDEVQAYARNLMVHRLGNLTLTTQALNSKVSNGPWPSKRRSLQDHDTVLMSRDPLRHEVWDEQAIVARTAALIDHILAIWPVPPGHAGRHERTEVPQVEVDLSQLVASGLLTAGTRIRPLSERHKGVEAAVAQDGRVFVGNIAYETPSGAGGSVTGYPINGWTFWIVDETRRSLADLRREYLESIGEVDAEVVDDSEGTADQALQPESEATSTEFSE